MILAITSDLCTQVLHYLLGRQIEQLKLYIYFVDKALLHPEQVCSRHLALTIYHP